jgi:lipopolysaccharide/colanic/teichoic acid biosynthesis glycosyltransferase
MQRFFDIVFSGIALVLLLPLLLPLMFILRVTGEGELFFSQRRVGRGGKHFKLYKFTTMLKDSPNIGPGTITVKNDPRVLPVGRFLRKTKINELPQLINIFNGDMSVIGPRPQSQRCFDAFPRSSQNEIIKVRPGLSGIGSIIFRDEEDMMYANNDPGKFYDEIVMPYKGSLEHWYVSHQNIASYFSLIGLTIWVVLGFSSGLVWKVFKDLPPPPEGLDKWIQNPID